MLIVFGFSPIAPQKMSHGNDPLQALQQVTRKLNATKPFAYMII